MNDVYVFYMKEKIWQILIFYIDLLFRSVFGIGFYGNIIIVVCGEVDLLDKGYVGVGYFLNEVFIFDIVNL